MRAYRADGAAFDRHGAISAEVIAPTMPVIPIVSVAVIVAMEAPMTVTVETPVAVAVKAPAVEVSEVVAASEMATGVARRGLQHGGRQREGGDGGLRRGHPHALFRR